VTDAAERVCGAGAVWRGPDGEVAARLLEDVIAHGAELGPLAPSTAPRAFMKLMQGREVPPAPGGESRIAIWGLLEARLQRRDLMVLGGLNEGVWPAPPPDDPFLSRRMRAELGLPSPDARIGLAAHDFAQLVSGPNVVLSRSLKRDGAPTVKSRWLWRLDALAKGAGAKIAKAQHAVEWARTLDAPRETLAIAVPRPTPPAHARLKRISVTQVETLIRDPYAVYSRRILGLEVLKPIGAIAEHAERGIAIHAAIEALQAGEDGARLLALLDKALREEGFAPERRVAEQARLAGSASMLIAWLETRRGAQVFPEASGKLELTGGEILSGKADRIEIGADGAGAILDFKTGAPPSDKQVALGLSPQLTLEAAMLARGAFEGVPTALVDELIYWRFGGSDPAPRAVKLDEGAHAAGEAALVKLETLLKKYADAKQPFLSSPRVQFVSQYRDYDHLARRKEWADAEGGE
jgi:ATP-dependent helicase/nuclease subunit B